MTQDLDKFVTLTLKLLEKERETEIEETRLLEENVSPKELQRRGICLLKLRIGSRHTGLYGRTVIVFEPYWPAGSTGEKVLPSHSFTPGDIAGIGESQSDSKSPQLASGIVSRVTSSSVSVAFDETHETLELDDDAKYRLIKLANDVTYKRLKKALGELSSYRSGPCGHLINVLFGVSELGPPLCVQRDGPDKAQEVIFFNDRLDESQQEAVRFALNQREVAIVHGPPGTGKTTTVVEIIRQAVLHRKLKVLACAPSNIAVDNLVERLAAGKVRVVRLGHPARLLHGIQRYSLDAILSSSDDTKLVNDVRKDMDNTLVQLKKTRHKGERQQLRESMKHLRKELRERETTATKNILKTAQVVSCTLTGASGDGVLRLLDEDHFDLVVIDEVSQSLEAACWLGLLRAPRCILAGDHNQLPPTILSRQAAKEGLETTLMERLLKEHGDAAMRMLTVQYRMNERIMAWASEQLYDGKLTAHESVAGHLLKDLPNVKDDEISGLPLLLIDSAGCDLNELDIQDEFSKGNEGEADIVAHHVEQLIGCGLAASEIAVITPYNLQVELLRLRLHSKHPSLEIKSVDGFQGREKEAVVISMVRSNSKGEVGFLAEDRRINVAITRARRHLAVVCDSDTVSRHEFLKSLVEYMTKVGEVRSAQEYIDAGAFSADIQRPEHLTSHIDESKQKEKNTNRAKADKKAKQHSNQKQQSSKATPTGRMDAGVEKTGKSEEDIVIEADLQQKLVEFCIDDSRTEYNFPASLSAWERKVVHEISEKLNFIHISEGIGENRHIAVKKPQQQQKQHQQKPQQHKQVDHSTGARPKSSKKQENISNKKQDSKDQSSDSKKDSLTEQTQTKEETEKTSDIVKCSICDKFVPSSNYELHRLRCVKPPSSAVPDATKAKKKKKPKSAKNAIEKTTDEDFDALIAAAQKENTVCNYPRCKQYTTVLGQNCEFCGKRFCITHHIAEGHGCGDRAKVKARMLISREGQIYRGSGVPDKRTDPAKRAYLERKLEKKIGEKEGARKLKKKDKKDEGS